MLIAKPARLVVLTKLVFGGLGFLAALAIASTFWTTIILSNSSATSAGSSLPVSVAVDPPTIALRIDPDNLNLHVSTPKPEGSDLATASTVANVKTNDPTGYTLSLAMPEGSDDNSLHHLTDPEASIPSLSGDATIANFPADRWGYSIDAPSSLATFHALPNVGSADILRQTSSATSEEGDDIDFTIGTRVSNRIASGSYVGSVALTATANERPSPVPAEYQEVEYLESSGTQYIDTGVAPSQNTVVEFNLANIDNTPWHSWFGSQTGAIAAALYTSNATNKIGLTLFNQSATYSVPNIGDKHTYTLDIPNRKVLVDGAQAMVTGAFVYTQLSNMYMFAAQIDGAAGSFSSCKIYSFKITESSEVKRNFKPAVRISDNKPGMYDIVHNTFYTNAGTGEFIPGPDV